MVRQSIPGSVAKSVLEVFQLAALAGGRQTTRWEGEVVPVFVQYIWVVIVHGGDDLVLAGARLRDYADSAFPGQLKTALWQQENEPNANYRISTTQMLAEPIGATDAVADSLHAIDLLPPTPPEPPATLRVYPFDVYTFTAQGEGHIAYRAEPTTAAMGHFWRAVKARTAQLAEMASDPNLDHFVKML